MNNNYDAIPIVTQLQYKQCYACAHMFEEGEVCGINLRAALCAQCYYNKMAIVVTCKNTCSKCHLDIGDQYCFSLNKDTWMFGCFTCFGNMKTHMFNFTYEKGSGVRHHSPASSGRVVYKRPIEADRPSTPVNQNTDTTTCPGAPERKGHK